jgi:PTS system galactitol-specific IIA component
MKSLLELLDRELTFWDLEAETDDEVIGFLADKLIRKGIAKESFKSAVIERERTAPTGLKTERIGVAMPHTTEEHVNRKGLAVGFLKSPVRFRAMGMPEEEVETRIVFLLALTDPHGHIDFLRELASAFEHSDILVTMAEARDFDRLTASIRAMA